MTFSIVAADLAAGEFGVAVESKFLAVGAVVPWARAGVGAIATQSWANPTYGPRGLDLLAGGAAPSDVLATLTGDDANRAFRQVGVVCAGGRAATYTGSDCVAWAGGVTGCDPAGNPFAAQGNILTGPEVVEAMAASFRVSAGALCDRLVAALQAGQAAGGDSRGQQSAALLVVKPDGGYSALNDRFVDLRVDDHPAPVDELERLLELHKRTFFKPYPPESVELDADTVRNLQMTLRRLGWFDAPADGRWDDPTAAAVARFAREEGLEALLRDDGRIAGRVLERLRDRFMAVRVAATATQGAHPRRAL